MERKIAGRTAEGSVNIEKLISNIIWLPVLFVLTVGEKLRKKISTKTHKFNLKIWIIKQHMKRAVCRFIFGI